MTFSLTVDGSTRKITTTESTLGEALNDADVVLHADDKVSLPLNKPVAEGASVTIVRVTAKAISEETVDAHTSSEVDDPELPKGDRVVETEGALMASPSTLTTSFWRTVLRSRARKL